MTGEERHVRFKTMAWGNQLNSLIEQVRKKERGEEPRSVRERVTGEQGRKER